MPKHPSSLRPSPTTRRSSPTTKSENRSPAPQSATRVAASSGMGRAMLQDLQGAAAEPSWPALLLPHPKARPAPRTKSVWSKPQDTFATGSRKRPKSTGARVVDVSITERTPRCPSRPRPHATAPPAPSPTTQCADTSSGGDAASSAWPQASTRAQARSAASSIASSPSPSAASRSQPRHQAAARPAQSAPPLLVRSRRAATVAPAHSSTRSVTTSCCWSSMVARDGCGCGEGAVRRGAGRATRAPPRPPAVRSL